MELTIVNVDDELLQDKNFKINLVLYLSYKGVFVGDKSTTMLITSDSLYSTNIAKEIKGSADRAITRSRKVLESKNYLDKETFYSKIYSGKDYIVLNKDICYKLMTECSDNASKFYLLMKKNFIKNNDYYFSKKDILPQLGYGLSYKSYLKVDNIVKELEENRLLHIIKSYPGHYIPVFY